jgi:hypothetical protein
MNIKTKVLVLCLVLTSATMPAASGRRTHVAPRHKLTCWQKCVLALAATPLMHATPAIETSTSCHQVMLQSACLPQSFLTPVFMGPLPYSDMPLNQAFIAGKFDTISQSLRPPCTEPLTVKIKDMPCAITCNMQNQAQVTCTIHARANITGITTGDLTPF